MLLDAEARRRGEKRGEDIIGDGRSGFDRCGGKVKRARRKRRRVRARGGPREGSGAALTELDFAGRCARLKPFGASLLRSALYLLFFVAHGAHAGQPLTPGDWWNWRDIGTPRINAEGSQVVYVENWNLRDSDRGCANLWTVATAGGAPRRLTDGPWRDTSPAWSPDGGRIAYLSDRDGAPEIWVRRLDTGVDQRITRLTDPPLTVAWSPDGVSLAYTART